MNILVSNDDGVDAIGLKTLVEHLKKLLKLQW
jgi:broad specificity polyphosphatase/5'/3'-nucleotidase SurE